MSWNSTEQSGEIFGQRFAASGEPLGPEFHVNTSTTGHQVRPAIAADGAGNFVVVWWDYPQPPGLTGNIEIFPVKLQDLQVH